MDTASLNTVLESLNKTSKGQLAYARDPLSECSMIDSRLFTITREAKPSRCCTMLLSERFKKLSPVPSKTDERLLDLSFEPRRISTEGASFKQNKWKEASMLSNSVYNDETTPVYNMSFEMLLQLFEENEVAPQNLVSTEIMNKYKQLEETTHRNPQQCEQRRKELETRLVPRSQTQSDMDHTLQRLQARAVLSRQKQNDLIETRIKDLQTQSEREKQLLVEENARKALESQRSNAYQRKALCAQQIDKSWKMVQEVNSTCLDREALSRVLQSTVMKLKELKRSFEATEKEMVASTKPAADAEKCENIEKEFKQLCLAIVEMIKTVNEEHKMKEALKKQQEEENAAAPPAPPKLEKEVAVILEPIPSKVDEKEETDYVHKKDFLLYRNLQSDLEKYQATYANILKDSSYKQFRFDCAKAVNVPINAISPQSGQHLVDKLDKLVNLLRGNVVEVPPRRFKATQHPGGIEYCTDLLAKKLVRQGEDVVSSKPEAAFAIAAIIHALWAEFPLLGRLILAHFYRTCPYLVPYYPPQQEGQNDQDYYKALGYEYIDGTVEKQDKFLKRMSGVVRLYAAVIVSAPRLRQQQPHPFGLQNGWKFLAATVNLTPRLEITATVLFNFLEVAGHRLSNAYGKQFIKLLHLLCTEYFALIRNATPDGSDGPVVRFDDFLQKTIKRREIAPPSGQLPSRFW